MVASVKGASQNQAQFEPSEVKAGETFTGAKEAELDAVDQSLAAQSTSIESLQAETPDLPASQMAPIRAADRAQVRQDTRGMNLEDSSLNTFSKKRPATESAASHTLSAAAEAEESPEVFRGSGTGGPANKKLAKNTKNFVT